MPYIANRDDRRRLDAGGYPTNEGELAYSLFRQMRRDWETSEKRYADAVQIIHDASIGGLDHLLHLAAPSLDWERRETILNLTILEFQRRILWPFEDGKRFSNGDVY